MTSSQNPNVYGYLCFAHLGDDATRKQRVTLEALVETAGAIVINERDSRKLTFFIPVGKEDQLTNISDFFKANNHGAKFRYTVIAKTSENRIFLAELSIEFFREEFEDLHQLTEKIDDIAQRPVKFRNQMKRLQALRNKAKFYSEMLGIDSSGFEKRLQAEIEVVNRGILATS